MVMGYARHPESFNLMKNQQDQVALFKLVFTHNWEDPKSDHAALRIQPNESVMAITSGACNVLGFLLFDPKVIYSVDINPTQSHLLALKVAAIKLLDFDDFLAFIGLRPSHDRLAQFEAMKSLLNEEAIGFWEGHRKLIAQGIFMNGQYERFIKVAGRFIQMLQGKKRVLGLFKEKSPEEQVAYFESNWDTSRFRYLFKILFNKYILARRGLVADYFHFDDGSTSFSESFYKRSKKAFRDIPVRSNYFLSLYLLGHYQNEKEVPDYLQKENYATIKERVDRIQNLTAEAQDWIDAMPDQSIDCFALSNICELMSEQDTHRLFTGVLQKSRPGGRVIFRNLMIPREVPEDLRGSIVKDAPLSHLIAANDRSFVYGKVAAYTINK